jgi:hypothetical protein
LSLCKNNNQGIVVFINKELIDEKQAVQFINDASFFGFTTYACDKLALVNI